MQWLRRIRPDLLLLLSLVLMILLHPIVDHGTFRRVLMESLTFATVIVASVRLSEIRSEMWPALVLVVAAVCLSFASEVFGRPLFEALKWWTLAAYFALTVVVLFSFLRSAHTVTESHLYTAISIYLLLGIFWFSVYCAIDTVQPGSVLYSGSTLHNRTTELLYFSLITLTTVGYGDMVPVNPEVRMLAALEAIVGVLYVAITVAILVNGFRDRQQNQ